MPAAAGRGFKRTEKCLRPRARVSSIQKSACGHEGKCLSEQKSAKQGPAATSGSFKRTKKCQKSACGHGVLSEQTSACADGWGFKLTNKYLRPRGGPLSERRSACGHEEGFANKKVPAATGRWYKPTKNRPRSRGGGL